MYYEIDSRNFIDPFQTDFFSAAFYRNSDFWIFKRHLFVTKTQKMASLEKILEGVV